LQLPGCPTRAAADSWAQGGAADVLLPPRGTDQFEARPSVGANGTREAVPLSLHRPSDAAIYPHEGAIRPRRGWSRLTHPLDTIPSMTDTTDRIAEIERDALAALARAEDDAGIEAWRTRVLGRSGELTGVLRGIGGLEAEERKAVGAEANRA